MFQALASPDAKHIEITDEETGIILSLHTDDPQFDDPPDEVAEKIVRALDREFHPPLRSDLERGVGWTGPTTMED